MMRNTKVAPYVFIAPFFTLFLIFWVGPIIYSFFLSFTEWDGMSAILPVGLANYASLLTDARFHRALLNTGLFVLGQEIIMVFLALVLAVALNAKLTRGRSIFRAIYFSPVTMSLAVVALVWNLLLSRDFGFINMALGTLGLPNNIGWLTDPNIALGSIVLMRVWRATGYYSVIILAGLQNVPVEFQEAAEIDGANSLQIFFKITLPLLRPIILFVIIMSSIWAFQLFDEPWILTSGGPNDATLTGIIYLYQQSFLFLNLGYGSAISYVLTFIMMGFSLLAVRYMREQY